MKAILFVLALLGAVVGRAQIVLDWYGAAAPAGLLLDNYPNATVAHSLRLLRSAYTGDCVVIRRASDNALDTIGFAGGIVDTATIKTFCSGTDCFVHTWFDQSANALHATQTTDANQPAVFTSGSFYYEGGRVAVYFDGSNDFMAAPHTFPTGDILTTHFMVIRQVELSGSYSLSCIMPAVQNTTDRRYIEPCVESSTVFAVRLQGGNTVFSTTNANTQSLYTTYRTTTNSNFIAFRNSVSLSVTSSGASKNLNIQSDSGFVLGGSAIGTYNSPSDKIEGYVQESIWWLSDESSNRTGIESDIMTFYGL